MMAILHRSRIGAGALTIVGTFAALAGLGIVALVLPSVGGGRQGSAFEARASWAKSEAEKRERLAATPTPAPSPAAQPVG